VAIESAPMVGGDPSRVEHEALLAALREDVARGEPDAALARFLMVGAGLPAAELEAFRATPRWAERVRTVPTVVRELDAALHDPALGMDALVTGVPVLQLVGTTSPRWFRDAAAALDARLPSGRLHPIDGAGHGSHHSHPGALAAAIESFPGG
jgi:pimeloyl-ACP methyl ester carboxylesterase